MTIDTNVRKLLRKTTELLKKAKMSNSQFKLDILECQSYLLRGYFEETEFQELQKMINLKPEDFGCEPNTGFEEAVGMSYLQGLRAGHNEDYNKGYKLGHDNGYDIGRDEGYGIGRTDGINIGRDDGIIKNKQETALRMRELGYDIEEISKITNLDSNAIKKL